MPLTIPPAVNYPSNLRAIPSLMQDEPRNGRQQIPCEVDWGTMGGAVSPKCVSFNVQGNAVLTFEQITTLKVDNSQCGVDVDFIFPDTSENITIPAGAPYALVPVLSNSLQFFVSATNPISSDVTRFQLLNYPVIPADVPQSVETVAASTGALTVVDGGPAMMQLIPGTISGTLETIQLLASVGAPPTATMQTVVTVQDGPGNVLVNGWNFAFPTTAQYPDPLYLINLPNLSWRFTLGLKISFAAGGGTGGFIANGFATYRTP